jgi:hypothetical protein
MACLRDPAHRRRRCGDVSARSAADECASAPTWPEGPKEGSRRLAPHGGPWRPASCGRSLRRCQSAVHLARHYPVRWPAATRRAPRALEAVEKVLTDRLARLAQIGAQRVGSLTGRVTNGSGVAHQSSDHKGSIGIGSICILLGSVGGNTVHGGNGGHTLSDSD